MIAIGLMLLVQAAGTAQPPALTPTPAQPAAAPVTVPVRLGVEVRPDTVTVGDRFTVIVRVRAPAGSTIQFPGGPDSSANVDLAADPVIAEARTIPGPTPETPPSIEQIAGYRLAAWDIGQQTLGLGVVVVRSGTVERRIPLASHTVFVKSVLPADTTLHVPKPPRDLLAFAWPWWLKWLLIALGILLAALIAWWLWRIYRHWKNRPVHPAALAQLEFYRIEKMGLPDKDEGARHVALMTDVLRTYLAARAPAVRESHTSRELVAAARQSGALDAAWSAGLAELLHETDLAKFAAARIAGGKARELGSEARAVVAQVESHFAEQEPRKAA